MKFRLTGFTSTSCEEKKALEFSYAASLKPDLVPVLFVMEAKHWDGAYKAYLHDHTLTGFPGEQEYLLGFAKWKVTAVRPGVTKEFVFGDFEVTEIHIKQW